ncbi:PilN domain-containing protein [Paraglaciecola sp. 2405UD69-4]|uniref:PilN domain-containing protein n=1 Tax=Paraglaciecola sp. 2405UD69-4 TaxID=3391836 RepID=UPI0039C98B47
MKTTVNLYQPELRPKLRLLSLQFMLLSWFSAILLCVLVYSFLLNTHNQSSAVLADLVQKQQRNDSLLRELRNDLSNLTVNPNLLENINRQQKNINFKKRILLEVQGHEKLMSHAFSDLMLDLAANHKHQLWLTRIHVDDNHVIIEGSSESSKTIPQWLGSLSNSNFFKGQEFAETRLYRGTDGILNFVLSSGKDTDLKELTENE